MGSQTTSRARTGNVSRMADICALAELARLCHHASRPANRKPIAVIFIVGALTAPDRRTALLAALWPFVTRPVAEASRPPHRYSPPSSVASIRSIRRTSEEVAIAARTPTRLV